MLLTVDEVLTEVGEVVTKNSWLGTGTAKGQATGWNVAPPLDDSIRNGFRAQVY
jgi:hypothetical protein